MHSVKKKKIWIFAVVFVCVVGVALGLFFGLAGSAGEDGRILQTEEEDDSGGIVNNGGSFIKVNGTPYYMNNRNLYSDGSYLYATNTDSYPQEVFRYNLDGSGFLNMFEGAIVDCTDNGDILYCVTENAEENRRELIAFHTETGVSKALFSDTQCEKIAYLGKYDGFLYVARWEEELLYIDSIKEADGSITRDLLAQGLEAEQVDSFYADEHYILFSAGAYEGSMGMWNGAFYSYNRSIGSLTEIHVTASSSFYVVNEYVYYQKYENTGEEAYGLFRTDLTFDNEEKIGDELTFLAYDESNDTLLAAKPAGQNSYMSDLVRVSMDGSEEQMLFLAEDLNWEMEEYDKIRFSELSIMEGSVYAKAEQWGFRGEHGWRDSLVREQYIWIKADGSFSQVWSIDWQMEEDTKESVVGTTCDPAVEGWDLNQIVDVRRDFWNLPYVPEEGTENRTYLLAQSEQYMLYGKGDYQSMLLACGGQYAMISFPYASNYMIPVLTEEADYDGDGITELAIVLNILHGTGVYIDTLFMADRDERGEITVYEFVDDDYLAQLAPHLSYSLTDLGMQAYIDGKEAGRLLFNEGEDGTVDYGYYSSVSVGEQIRFYAEDGRVTIEAGLEFWNEDFPGVSGTNGNTLNAVLSYRDGGVFTLTDFSGRHPELENVVTEAVNDFYKGAQDIRIEEIQYDISAMNGDTMVVTATVLSETGSYDYVSVESEPWGESLWRITDLTVEKQ